MKYESMSIKKVVQMISDNELLLPHIQRPFVWKQDRNHNQVKRFLDSILRSYPFGTLLFWITKDDIQIRRFTEDYRDGMDVKDSYIKSSEYKDRKKILVLDGQQRLQALYIALKGTYNNKELYFDVLSGDRLFWDGQDELKYNFEYLTKNEAKETNINNEQSYWVLLKDIVLSNEDAVKIRRDILGQMKTDGIDDKEVEERVDKNVAKVKNLFNDLELIYYYPIDSTIGKITDYEEILEIFIRANSGGTILSKSDLMFSLIKLNWEDAEDEFEDLLNTMNGQGAFYFDKDFILKTSLVLIGKGAKYEIKKFKGKAGEKNLENIKTNWQKMVESFYWLKDFLDYSRITSNATLPSYNVLIPIIYFAYIHNNKSNSPKVKYNMQSWLYKTLLNGNFSGQSDSVIDVCKTFIERLSKDDYFPFTELDLAIEGMRKVVDVNPNIIDGNSHLVLNLLYILNKQIIHFQPNLNGNSPEIDHIFPKSKMLRTYKFPSNLVNNIGNYMFLEKSLNINKKNRLPGEYFPGAIKEQPNFYERNFIPPEIELHNPAKFEEFVRARRETMFDAIKGVLKYQD